MIESCNDHKNFKPSTGRTSRKENPSCKKYSL